MFSWLLGIAKGRSPQRVRDDSSYESPAYCNSVMALERHASHTSIVYDQEACLFVLKWCSKERLSYSKGVKDGLERSIRSMPSIQHNCGSIQPIPSFSALK